MKYIYPCNIVRDVVEFEETGREAYMATFPDVPGANTGGDTFNEAFVMAEDCLVAALGAHYRTRRPFPLPSPLASGQYGIPLSPVVAAKVALNVALQEQGLTKVALGEMLGVTESNVRKLCDPDHHSHIRLVDRALRVLGRQLVVEDVEVAGSLWPGGRNAGPRPRD